jgi:dipeptidyl-peptidase-4
MLAQSGYLVASIDNRGTRSPRGRAWRKIVHRNFGPLATHDQAKALAAMREKFSFVDGSRVGVWGRSGGGSMTLNLLFRHPADYHVGVSVAPVPDQRLYDSIYQERFSGLLHENVEGYARGSPITHAAGLEGHLLLIHGTADDNVHMRGTEALINELVKLDKRFDIMIYPGRRHRISRGDGTVMHKRGVMTDYFLEHLPPSRGHEGPGAQPVR